MKPEKYTKDVVRGTVILTAAALFIKILSAIYRVPFQNLVGDVGFYIYQQVYPFYGVAITFAAYGFPVVLSKLYTEELNANRKGGLSQLFFTSAAVLGMIGLLFFGLLFWGAQHFATVMGDPELEVLFRVISFAFLLFPAVALLRGFFQGKGDMVPTAVSQVGEQLVRVAVIFLAALFLTKEGYNLYMVGAGATFGSIMGGIAAILILMLFFAKRWTQYRGGLSPKLSFSLARSIVLQGFAICISSMLLILMQLADSLNLYSQLISSGFGAHEAKEMKGVYDRGMPLIQVGMVVATSMSLSLVPVISNARINARSDIVLDKIRLTLQIGITVGTAATVGLWNIIKPTNIMLFENSAGSAVLGVLSMVILLSSVAVTASAILQGLGMTMYPAFIIISGFVLKYLMNILLIPVFSTMGAAFATCLSLCFVLILLLIRLKRELKVPILSRRFLLTLAAASAAMLVVLKVYLYGTGLLGFAENRLYAGFQALSAVVIGGLIYIWIILKGDTFKEEELSMLPFGSKLMLFLPKKNRSESR